MQFAANIFDVLILVGAIQGLIIGVLLFKSQSILRANRFLAWILFLLSLACLNIFLLETNIGFNTTWWDILTAIVPMTIIMPIGPLIFFYVRDLLAPNTKFTRFDRRHFYPLILDLIPELLAIGFILGVLLQLVDPQQSSNLGRLMDHFDRYSDIPRWLSISYYLWRSWQLIQKHLDNPGIQKKWPQQMLKGFALFQFIWLIHLIPYLLPQTSNLLLSTFSWYPVYIPMMVLVYWLGIKGFMVNRELQLRPKPVRKKNLDAAFAQKVIQELNYKMQEEKYFLNPNLNLKIIVDQTSFSQKQISAALNQYLGKNFNEYVNGFRVKEAQKRLLDTQYQNLTIAAIAYDCGFNSLATFQRTFKSFTGQTPKAFQQKSHN